MSIVDKVISAVTPPESEEKRIEARRQARSSATAGDWLSAVLDQHEQLEQAFADVRAATDAASRRRAQKQLATLLTGHSMAEEAVLYPELAHVGKTMNAEMAYTQQVHAKMTVAGLDHDDPMSEDYLDKLGHLEGAVRHHMFEEEHDWFPALKALAPPADQELLRARYLEEWSRYMSGGEGDAPAPRQGQALPPHTETI